MGVGSLHKPREYDGRLPPDVGYYLDLVLPRKEEPRKKIGSQVRLLHGRILQIRWSTYMQSDPRIVVNLLVILVKLLVHLPVKLTTGGIRPVLVAILDLQGLVREVFGGFQGSHGGLGRRCASPTSLSPLYEGPMNRPIFTDFYRFLPIFRTFFLPSYLLPLCVPGRPPQHRWGLEGQGLPGLQAARASPECIPRPRWRPPNPILVSFTSRFASISTSITSQFADNLE